MLATFGGGCCLVKGFAVWAMKRVDKRELAGIIWYKSCETPLIRDPFKNFLLLFGLKEFVICRLNLIMSEL